MSKVILLIYHFVVDNMIAYHIVQPHIWQSKSILSRKEKPQQQTPT